VEGGSGGGAQRQVTAADRPTEETDRKRAVVAPGGGGSCGRSCGVIRRWRQKSLVVALFGLNIAAAHMWWRGGAAVAAHTV